MSESVADIVHDVLHGSGRRIDACSALLQRKTEKEHRLRPELVRDPALVPHELQDAFIACRLAKEPWPLMVWGGAGGGKTRFALIVHDWYGGRLVDYAELVAEYAMCRRGELHDDRYINEPIMREHHWTKMITDYRLLTIDDIGAREDTECARECLMRVLNAREGGRPTILISNMPPAKIAKIYDDRVASRMCAGKVVKINEPDRRLD